MHTQRILIVGGGSAGWMAAAYLNAALNSGVVGENNAEQKVAEITLVESPDVPRIGVGEATIPNINHILQVIGIDELTFMRAVDGTFKQSIRYVNWLRNKGEFYHHPFSRYRPSPIDRSGRSWLMSDRSIAFMDTVSAQPVICELGLAPKQGRPGDFGSPLTYAYHMNAQKFADFLTQHATQRGVTHYRDHVVEVKRSENGDIGSVHTRNGLTLEADLYIDCTGFASLLIEKTLGVKFLDYSQWLLCDRATTMHVPYDRFYPGYVRPYTQASACSAGWVWEIPLQTGKSLGYVHSSEFISETHAEQELRTLEGPHCEPLDTRLIKFKVGRREKVWVGNCLAIGLAGGFIEPLESTGLYLSDLATVMLAEHFPFARGMDTNSQVREADYTSAAFRVNRIMANRFYEVLDFINMHYCLSKRTDTLFWQEVQKSDRINDRLAAKLEYWRSKPPSASDFEDQFFPGQSTSELSSSGIPGDHRTPIDTAGLWNHESYETILYGMDFMRDEFAEMYGPNLPKSRVFRQVFERLRMAPQIFPPHDIWLRHNVGMKEYPKTI